MSLRVYRNAYVLSVHTLLSFYKKAFLYNASANIMLRGGSQFIFFIIIKIKKNSPSTLPVLTYTAVFCLGVVIKNGALDCFQTLSKQYNYVFLTRLLCEERKTEKF